MLGLSINRISCRFLYTTAGQWEYSSKVWSPFTKKSIAMIESVQRQAARFVTSNYQQTSSINSTYAIETWLAFSGTAEKDSWSDFVKQDTYCTTRQFHLTNTGHLLILVKALLQVLYDKTQHEEWGQVADTARGKAECCICHETPPQVLYFIIQHEYTVHAFTD